MPVSYIFAVIPVCCKRESITDKGCYNRLCGQLHFAAIYIQKKIKVICWRADELFEGLVKKGKK